MSNGKSKLPLHMQALISDAQLAEFLGIESTVQKKTLCKLPHRKIGHTKVFRVQDIWDALEGTGNV